MNKYPRKNRWQPDHPGKQKKCIVCGYIPAGFLDIEFNEMRGDDGVYKVCKQCAKFPPKDIITAYEKESNQ